MKKIAFYNNKGGVGKTTTVINVAYTLQTQGYKVLIIDCDSQQNSSRFFISEQYEGNLLSKSGVGIESVLIGVNSYIPPLSSRYNSIDIKISSGANVISEFALLSEEQQVENVSQLLGEHEYDYILLDLPPAMSVINEKLMQQCNCVFVPIELGTFAIQGISTVTETINRIGSKFGGCFVSKFDKSNPADNDLLELLRQSLGSKVLKTLIPYSRVIKNSISYKLSAHEYMAWEEATQRYTSLTNEIVSKA